MSSTHELYVQGIRDAAVAEALRVGTITTDEATKLHHTKLVYGVGAVRGARGVTIFEAWENGIGRVDVVEISALFEESWIQLAGTTIHELGHVLAGKGAGHAAAWKAASTKLGLRLPVAAGATYRLPQFPMALRCAIVELASKLSDGKPEFGIGAGAPVRISTKPRPCSQGIGTKGGTSRGAGSGSRMRLYECQCQKPVKVRVASDTFEAHCDVCGAAFAKVEKVEKAESSQELSVAADGIAR